MRTVQQEIKNSIEMIALIRKGLEYKAYTTPENVIQALKLIQVYKDEITTLMKDI